MKAEIVTVGDELLLGFTVDTNAAAIGRELSTIGVEIVRRSTVGDDPDAIMSAVRDALERSGAVITTGGLGPTPDDRTLASVASLFGRELRREESIVQELNARWAKLGRRGPVPESNFRQALVPDGATVLRNSHGTAPGIWLEDDRRRWVAMLPGVPREMREMLSGELVPRLRAILATDADAGAGSGPVIRSRTLRTTGIPESGLADLLGDLGADAGGVAPAFLPGVQGVDIRLTTRGLPADEAGRLLEYAIAKLRERIGGYVYGEDATDLAEVVLQSCRRAGLRLAVAESCTGGLLGTRLTEIPGSSDVFVGGVIAYDDSVKLAALGVDPAVLRSHGAVSEETARAMARGARQRLGAEVAIAVTGIAGPAGGTADKPVGTVWLAADGTVKDARLLRLVGTRGEIRQRAAQAALDLVRRSIQGD